MAQPLTATVNRSGLNKVNNDTGRTAYCGPYILSALTGFPISHVEAEVNRFRRVPCDAKIEGTSAIEVAAAATELGWEMTLIKDFLHLERKQRPTLWNWMQKPRNAWVYYLLAIHRGKQGHWVLVKGVKLCDTYTEGQWQFVCDGPHRGARIMEIYQLRSRG
jgi:signal recognition particle subunit SEC65